MKNERSDFGQPNKIAWNSRELNSIKYFFFFVLIIFIIFNFLYEAQAAHKFSIRRKKKEGKTPVRLINGTEQWHFYLFIILFSRVFYYLLIIVDNN